MYATSFSSKATTKTAPDSGPVEQVQAFRETVESIVVAFILAFLFRAFVAEAFVIPTGSMAPTLMGAHKDIVCEHCGKQYQSSASSEFDLNNSDNEPRIFTAYSNSLVVASTCPLCRGLNSFDLYNNANHASFSGDRILVSKFDYVLHDPKRWDVIVFKYPKAARMNYIKRLVGLPGEQLRIKGGDVYTRRSDQDPWQIARKPADKVMSMRQSVSDSDYQPKALVAAGWPSLWQPQPIGVKQAESPNRWSIQQTPEKWSASLTPGDATSWLRYYHKVFSTTDWQRFATNPQLPKLEPLSSTLITDFTAYNSSFSTNRAQVYDKRTNRMLPEMQGEKRPFELLNPGNMLVETTRQSLAGGFPKNDGDHWVGDLACSFDVLIQSPSGTLSVLLVEQGIRFVAEIDVATGKITLSATDGSLNPPAPAALFSGASELHAQAHPLSKGRHQVEFSNFDDQLLLWIDGRVVAFDKPATFDLTEYHPESARRPYWTENDPLDAAPVGLAGSSLAMDVTRARVWRDIYYIAISGNNYCDYNLANPGELIRAIPDASARQSLSFYNEESGKAALAMIYSQPQWWSQTGLFNLRGSMHFGLTEDQYFPMGDNSAASLDARGWDNNHFVQHRYMLGKALLVFWPHHWNRPIPGWPNFTRMRLIR